jgi:hypothetical protein
LAAAGISRSVQRLSVPEVELNFGGWGLQGFDDMPRASCAEELKIGFTRRSGGRASFEETVVRFAWRSKLEHHDCVCGGRGTQCMKFLPIRACFRLLSLRTFS